VNPLLLQYVSEIIFLKNRIYLYFLFYQCWFVFYTLTTLLWCPSIFCHLAFIQSQTADWIHLFGRSHLERLDVHCSDADSDFHLLRVSSRLFHNGSSERHERQDESHFSSVPQGNKTQMGVYNSPTTLCNKFLLLDVSMNVQIINKNIYKCIPPCIERLSNPWWGDSNIIWNLFYILTISEITSNKVLKERYVVQKRMLIKQIIKFLKH
jgi:hypothetical protein